MKFVPDCIQKAIRCDIKYLLQMQHYDRIMKKATLLDFLSFFLSLTAQLTNFIYFISAAETEEPHSASPVEIDLRSTAHQADSYTTGLRLWFRLKYLVQVFQTTVKANPGLV